MGRMKDIAIEQMNEEQQNNDYALSLNNQLRAVEEDRDRLYKENCKLKNKVSSLKHIMKFHIKTSKDINLMRDM